MKSDIFMKSKDGRDAENIYFGSTLSNDRLVGRQFDYLIANPPYGKDWKRDEDAVRAEHERGGAGRGPVGRAGRFPRAAKGGSGLDSGVRRNDEGPRDSAQVIVVVALRTDTGGHETPGVTPAHAGVQNCGWFE